MVKILEIETTRREDNVYYPLRDYTLDSYQNGDDIVRSLWRHKEIDRNDLSLENIKSNKKVQTRDVQ